MHDQYWHYPQSVLISTDIIHDQFWSLLVLSMIIVVHYWNYPWSVLIIADIIHDKYWSLPILSMISVDRYWYYPWSILIITDIVHDHCWSLLILSMISVDHYWYFQCVKRGVCVRKGRGERETEERSEREKSNAKWSALLHESKMFLLSEKIMHKHDILAQQQQYSTQCNTTLALLVN